MAEPEEPEEENLLPLPPDPEWQACTDHPGKENHCSSGWCGQCWLCQANGVTPLAVQAYEEGLQSGMRRRGGKS